VNLDTADSNTHSQATSDTPRGIRPHAPMAPGDMAVDGPVADDYTVMAPPEVASQMNPVEPVIARIVENSEEDVEFLQEQLHQRNEELERIRRERENVAVAHVISNNDEEGAQNGNNEEESLSGEAHGSRQQPNYTGKKSVGMKWIVTVVLLLVIVGIVLGVVIPMTLKPTSTPTVPQDPLTALLSSVSFDNGTALQTSPTPQNDALKWLAGNTKLDSYSDEQKIQRYVLATLYYSTGSGSWVNSSGWITDIDECEWYNDAEGTFCSGNGAVVELNLYFNNLVGTIPKEVAST